MRPNRVRKIRRVVDFICIVILVFVLCVYLAAGIDVVGSFISEMLTWTWPYGGNGQWLW